MDRERSDLDAQLLKGMTSDDGMTRVRKAHLAEDEGMNPAVRMQLCAELLYPLNLQRKAQGP